MPTAAPLGLIFHSETEYGQKSFLIPPPRDARIGVLSE